MGMVTITIMRMTILTIMITSITMAPAATVMFPKEILHSAA